MGKLGCLAGVLLIIVGFAALFFFTIIPPETRAQDASIVNLQNALFCKPNERYVEVLGGYVTNSSGSSAGRSFSAYCENVEGQRREVTGRSFAIMAGAFAVPFLVGLVLCMVSLVALVNRGKRTAMQSVVPISVFGSQPGESFSKVSVVTVNGQPVDNIPPEAAEVLRQVMGGFQTTASQFASGSNDLAGKLRQLQEARDAGLITEEEFSRLRQQIMDKMEN